MHIAIVAAVLLGQAPDAGVEGVLAVGCDCGHEPCAEGSRGSPWTPAPGAVATVAQVEEALAQADAAKRQGAAGRRLAALERAVRLAGAARQSARDGAAAAPLGARAACDLAVVRQEVADRIRLEGSGKVLEAAFKQKRAATTDVTTLAALCRDFQPQDALLPTVLEGEASSHFAAAIVAAQTPSEVVRLGEEAVAAYRDVTEQQARALCQRAVPLFNAALATPGPKPDAALQVRARAGQTMCVGLTGADAARSALSR